MQYKANYRERKKCPLRKISVIIGMCLLSAGIGILIACFLPTAVLVCTEALLLIIAGFLCLRC